MTRPGRPVQILLVLVALLLVGAGIAAAVPGERTLVVERVDTGEVIITAPVSNGTTVGLEYMHSVEKTRVYDEYTIQGDRLVNTRMEFESYGWGLPSRANVTEEDGMFVYDPPGELRELTVKPGTVADHTLFIGDREYDLVNRSDATSVTISIERHSLLSDLLEGH